MLFVLALIFVGCYFLGGVKDFSWLYLLPFIFIYILLSERYILTDNQLIICSGFLGKHPINLSRIDSIISIKDGFAIEYLKSNGNKTTLSILRVDNQQQMMDEIKKRISLNSDMIN